MEAGVPHMSSAFERDDERFAVEYKPADARIAGMREAIELLDSYIQNGGNGVKTFRDCLLVRLHSLEGK